MDRPASPPLQAKELQPKRTRPLLAHTCWAAGLLLAAAPMAQALPRTWIGGNVEWVDGGAAGNWNPNDEPDSDDEAIFNTANSVNLGSNNAVNGLTLSGGIDLFTNDFDLSVDGLVQLTGASTILSIEGAAGSMTADDATIGANAVLDLAGGTLNMDEELGSAVIDIEAGGVLRGNGVIRISDVPAVPTALLINDGTLTALSRGLTIFSPPPVGSLNISDAGITGRVDLDGTGEAGIVNVNRNQTLLVETPLADTFNSTLNLFHESTFHFIQPFTLGAGGSIVVNNGFVAGGLGISDIPAGTAYLEIGQLTQSGGTINVTDTDGTLQIDAPFTMTAGSFTNSGTVVFNGATNITTAVGYDPADINSQTIINNSVTITDVAGNFNWDGNGAADTTINAAGSLSVSVAQIDTGDDVFGGTITLVDGGDLTVNVGATSWTLAGSMIKNGLSTSLVLGDRIVITGQVLQNEGTLDLPAVTTSPTSAITANGRLTLGGGTEFNGASTLAGSGVLLLEGVSTVLGNTTVGTATFDWDGIGTGTTHTINSGVTFTINSGILDGDGDMDDPLVLAGNLSQLVVNNTNGLTEWTMAGVTTGNASTAGTATLGGTSRVIVANVINVDGNTTIAAPVTFNRAGLVADIDAGKILDVTSSNAQYVGGTIDGAGTFDPGISNEVTGDFTINCDGFDLDGGTWTIQEGAELTFNAIDYEPDSVTNSFESTFTLNNGGIFANSPDPAIVMNGTLNMNASGGNAAEWIGDPIQIGNDAGSLDANLNVTGDGNPNSQGRFVPAVAFSSDADVEVPAGAFLNFLGNVDFNTVNAANTAEFTGAGTMAFNRTVNVNEPVTLDLPGGAVDLDGNDASGEFINIDAPLTINAATLANFGRVNGGGSINTLDVNSSVGTGILTVNLDDPGTSWTLNGPGVMNLVNDNALATLLAGSDIKVNGTINITGEVRSTARLDIAGVVTINTANEPFRLLGGTSATPNTLLGGTLSGIGRLNVEAGTSLHGFGTVTADIDCTGTLFADNGTLTLNGDVLNVARIGTADTDGVLNVVNPWNTAVTSAVSLQGGTLQGGTCTINNATGIAGTGLITSRLINNTSLRAAGGTLVAQTAANDNDWDGAGGGGLLRASSAGTLEIRDAGPPFGFTGSVLATDNSRVFANGFALDFNAGSSLNLTSSTYESSASTDIGGTVTVNAGNQSTLKVQNNSFLTFEPACVTTLNADLVVQNNNIIVEAGATFGGTGALKVPAVSHLLARPNADINVLFENAGSFRPGGFDTVGRVDLRDYQQSSTGKLITEIQGNALNQFDRLVVDGAAVLSGFLDIDIDGGFVPVAGQTYDIITATGGVSGEFLGVTTSELAEGLVFDVTYLPTAVRLTVVAGNHYDAWILDFPSLANPADRLRTADPDGDGLNNLAEFAFNEDPTSGGGMTRFFPLLLSNGSESLQTITLPMRFGTVKFPPVQPVGELILEEPEDGMNYIVQGSDTLGSFPLEVTEVIGPQAATIQAGLPPVDPGWTYRTFQTTQFPTDDRRFMRVLVTE